MYKSIVGLTLAAAVSAHQNFHQFWVNDVTPGYQVGIRMPPSNSPVTDVTSNDIACNVDGSKVPSNVQTVAAKEGDKITVKWDTSGHPGPITHFLFGPVDDAAQATGVGAGWFKIDELDYKDGKWANEVVMANGGNYTFSLPAGLASGEYLLRSEMLALHGAQTVGGAQFYIGCAQLKIAGTGSGSCGPTISLPGAYKAEDANIYIPNVYNGFDPTGYTAPGGAVATCGGSGSSPAPTTAAQTPSAPTSAVAASSIVATSSASVSAQAPPSSAASTAVDSSSAPEPTDVDDSCDAEKTGAVPVPTTLSTLVRTSSAATPAVTGSVALYGQCGGINFQGSTSCASGATCKEQNAYYSQCVPA